MSIAQGKGEARIEREAEANIGINGIAWINFPDKDISNDTINIPFNVPQISDTAIDHDRVGWQQKAHAGLKSPKAGSSGQASRNAK
jgi:hypothetical protein